MIFSYVGDIYPLQTQPIFLFGTVCILQCLCCIDSCSCAVVVTLLCIRFFCLIWLVKSSPAFFFPFVHLFAVLTLFSTHCTVLLMDYWQCYHCIAFVTNLFEIQTWIFVCRGWVGVCLALDFGGCFCFSAMLFACNVYPRSQGLFLLQESKLTKFWLQMFHVLHPPLTPWYFA